MREHLPSPRVSVLARSLSALLASYPLVGCGAVRLLLLRIDDITSTTTICGCDLVGLSIVGWHIDLGPAIDRRCGLDSELRVRGGGGGCLSWLSSTDVYIAHIC